MNRLILFLKKSHVFVIFVLMEVLALSYYANSTSYTQARLLTISNNILGGAYDALSGIRSYFSLKKENIVLTEEAAMLRNELASYQQTEAQQLSVVEGQEINNYIFSTARVINNSVTRQENYFTLNKGMRDGVRGGMAVISPDGVAVGYVHSTSEKFAVCMSVLNVNFRTSGRIKGGDYFGSIYWDGVDPYHITMSELSKYAVLEKGDTVVTTEYSSIFPPGITIGTVEDFSLAENESYFTAKVKLGTHLPALNNVFLSQYTDAIEQTLLEREVSGEDL